MVQLCLLLTGGIGCNLGVKVQFGSSSGFGNEGAHAVVRLCISSLCFFFVLFVGVVVAVVTYDNFIV